MDKINHTFKNNNKYFLYLSDYKQLFEINESEYKKINNKEKFYFEKYYKTLNEIDTIEERRVYPNRYVCSHGCSYNDYILTSEVSKKNKYWCEYSKKMTELSLSLVTEMPVEVLEKILGCR